MILTIFLTDDQIKSIVERGNGKERLILFKSIRLRKYHNKGIAFDVFENIQPMVAAVSAALSVLLGIGLYDGIKKGAPTGKKMGLAMMLGGALSNTLDRLKRHYVTDYFSFNFGGKKLKQIVFNISDFFILIGAIITTWYSEK